MNYEVYFVKQFIVRSRRDRLLYELQSPTKRRNGIGRFCHDTENLIDNTKRIVSGKHLTAHDFEKCLGNPKCHVIAYYPELDGLSCTLHEALEKVAMVWPLSLSVRGLQLSKLNRSGEVL